MVPYGDVWNYNFKGVKNRPDMDYSVHVDVHIDFYDSKHRRNLFMNFAAIEQTGFGPGSLGTENLAEQEDWLS